MTTYTEDELKIVLEQHKLWLESDGEEGQKAVLNDADLSEADLNDADLRWADLSNTNLNDANLRWVIMPQQEQGENQ